MGAAWTMLLARMRSKRSSLVAFALAAGFFHWLVAVSFPAIGGIATVQSAVQTFPPGLRTLLKLAPNLQAGFGIQDYLAFSWFHPIFLGLGAAFVVIRATAALAGSVESGAAYLLLSRPVARWALVVGGIGELLIGVGLIVLAAWLGLVLGTITTLDGALPFGRYLLVAGLAWLLFGALGAGALWISSLTGRTDLAGGVGSAWTLIAFVLDVMPQVANSPIGWINPWHYYFPQAVVATGQVEPLGILVMVGWILIGTVGAAICFGRRDLL